MLGLLFGSFDPLHNGHLQIARWALAQGCDDVWLMVQPGNAYKNGRPLAPLDQRVAMAALAVGDSAKLQAVQVGEEDPAHIILNALMDLSNHDLAVILGSDLAESLPDWPDYQQIKRLATILTHPRFNTPSSSVVRARIAAGEPIDDAVPANVAEFIEQGGLYRP